MVDFNKLREAKQRLDNPGNGKRNDLWKAPENETTVIRLLPLNVDGIPFHEIYFHYGLGETLVCPRRTSGKQCPVCNFVSRLYEDSSEESKNLAREIRAKVRYFAAVALRDEEEAVARWYGISKTNYNWLIETMLDDDFGDITDAKTGTDIKVTVTPKNPPQQLYPKTTFKAARKPSKYDNADKLVAGLKDIWEVYPRKEYDDIKSILESYLDPNGEGSENRELYGNKGKGTGSGQDKLEEKLAAL